MHTACAMPCPFESSVLTLSYVLLGKLSRIRVKFWFQARVGETQNGAVMPFPAHQRESSHYYTTLKRTRQCVQAGHKQTPT